MDILVINGPNLNLLGQREPGIYGNQTFEQYFVDLKTKFSQIEFDYFQSNIEGEIIDKIHEVGFSYSGIILNAGAYTHTSIAIADAIKAVDAGLLDTEGFQEGRALLVKKYGRENEQRQLEAFVKRVEMAF